MIFIDTGALLARYLSQDQHYKDSIEYWEFLKANRRQCCLSNFVLDELFTLLGRKSNYHFAASVAKTFYASDFFTIFRPHESDEILALEKFEKFADQEICYTDCMSFILMEKHGIEEVFTFDRHFSYAGFDIKPGLK